MGDERSTHFLSSMSRDSTLPVPEPPPALPVPCWAAIHDHERMTISSFFSPFASPFTSSNFRNISTAIATLLQFEQARTARSSGDLCLSTPRRGPHHTLNDYPQATRRSSAGTSAERLPAEGSQSDHRSQRMMYARCAPNLPSPAAFPSLLQQQARPPVAGSGVARGLAVRGCDPGVGGSRQPITGCARPDPMSCIRLPRMKNAVFAVICGVVLACGSTPPPAPKAAPKACEPVKPTL